MAISKREEIAKELQKQGYEATEQHIEGVLAILRNDGRASVPSATRRYIQQLNPQTEQPKSDRQTSPNTTEENPTEEMLFNLTMKVSNNQVNFINNAALNLTMQRLLMGDMGELTPETKAKLDEFDKQMKEVKTIDVNFLELASTTSQRNLLLSSEKAENQLLLTSSEPTS